MNTTFLRLVTAVAVVAVAFAGCKEVATKQTFTVNGVSFSMVAVEGGTFTMGCTSHDHDCKSDEKPSHRVTLSNFSIGEFEVTQQLWTAVMGKPFSTCFKGDDLPVDMVNWDSCQIFIDRLNDLTGERFRLPTEAEWEYAARGGSMSEGYKYSGGNNIALVAWFVDNSEGKTCAVGTKAPNELGLYDMSGNVWEWCSDWYGAYSSAVQTNPTGGEMSSDDRLLRGGSWGSYAQSCRVAFRHGYTPEYRDHDIGFRLALP